MSEFLEFASKEKLGTVTPDQCEITYFNHIERSDLWQNHNQIDKIFKLGNFDIFREILGTLESTHIKTSHVISDTREKPIGRLYIDIEPVFLTANHEPIFKLTLSAKGSPMGNGINGVLDFLDFAHEMVVDCFIQITTDNAHNHWRMKNV